MSMLVGGTVKKGCVITLTQQRLSLPNEHGVRHYENVRIGGGTVIIDIAPLMLNRGSLVTCFRDHEVVQVFTREYGVELHAKIDWERFNP